MPGDVLVTADALARTYDTPSYSDPIDAVEDYRRVMRYKSKHPNKGSQAIATALELPRGRIRPWLDGAKPDAVRAIDTARDYGWLECAYDDPEFAALNRLVANIFSGGSIAAATYKPGFALADGADSPAVDALEAAGVDYQLVTDRDGRADEARPTDDGSVLGRVIAVLDAPVGPKADQRLSLPAYLSGAPDDVREQFARTYLLNRGQRHNGILKFREERNPSYLEALRNLLAEVTNADVTISEQNVMLSKEATEALGLAD